MSGREGRGITSRRCLFFLILMYVLEASSLTCPPGTHYSSHPIDILDSCIQCPDTSFMSAVDHQEEWCTPCEKIKDSKLEILVSPCNQTHDAVIHCVEGYYRDLARNPRETGTCKKCTNCSDYNMYTGQPCSTYKDTTCCPRENDVPECREISGFCGQGQYFNNSVFQCLQCPNNTFMHEDSHVRLQCFKCRDYTSFEVNNPLDSVIVQPCNSTHDAVLRCQDGFYIKLTRNHRSATGSIGCSLCTNCSTTDDQYEGRKCDSMHDTVCCPQANMTVKDTLDGAQCKPLPPITAQKQDQQAGTAALLSSKDYSSTTTSDESASSSIPNERVITLTLAIATASVSAVALIILICFCTHKKRIFNFLRNMRRDKTEDQALQKLGPDLVEHL